MGVHVEITPSQRIFILEDRLHTQYAKLKHYVGRTGRKRCCNKDCVKLENEANSSDTLTNQSVTDDFLISAVTHGKYHYCL